MISVDEALDRLLAAARPVGTETVAIAEAAGRVTSAPIISRLTQPPFDASAMDGYAVGPGEGPYRLVGTAQAGLAFDGALAAGECVRIFTGAPVPAGAIAVVMQEVAQVDGNAVRFAETPQPGQHIRPAGNDFASGQPVIDAGLQMTAARLTLAAASGMGETQVYRRPRVTIFSTGDELVPPGTLPGPSQIVASNALGVAALLGSLSNVSDGGIVRDDPDAISAALNKALSTSDIVVTIGGASVGDHDHIGACLNRIGATTDFWKIAMRPGKPFMFATSGKTLILGLPGNPVSALVTARVLGLPVLRAASGLTVQRDIPFTSRLAAALPPNGPRRHYHRATRQTGPSGTELVHPLPATDSAHLTSFASADTLVIRPENDSARSTGDPVSCLTI